MRCCHCPKDCESGESAVLLRTYSGLRPEDDEFRVISVRDVQDLEFDEAGMSEALDPVPDEVLATIEPSSPQLVLALRRAGRESQNEPMEFRLVREEAAYIYCHGEHLCIRARRRSGTAAGSGSPQGAPA